MTTDRRIFLIHALDCIDFITEQLLSLDKRDFLENRIIRNALLRNLEVVGQSFKDYGIEPLESTHPAIRWRQIAGFRNQHAHEYLGLDHQLIWGILNQHLRPLRQALSEHLEAQP
ncbi:MAG: DUF86 domain-containing protein [Azonexus sp.]|nr:DUF86 domain-containing protein [Azonexus sp.]